MNYINTKLNVFNNAIKGKRIAILGIGVSNRPSIEYFLEQNAIPVCFDSKDETEMDADLIDYLKEKNVEYHFGKNNLDYLEKFDYIFRSPSIRPDTPQIAKAVEDGTILTSEIEQVMELSPSHIIGITGSDGKSTTTSIIYNIINNAGLKCFLGGNIGFPLFTKIREMDPDDYVVLELSSFQLLTFTKSPEIAIVTNVTPNHLDIHKDYDEYINAKKNIFINQNPDDLLIINYDNEITRSFEKEAKGKVLFFSHKEKLSDGIFFDEKDRTIKAGFEGKIHNLVRQKDMKLIGEHNCENACAAIAATKDLVKTGAIKKTIEEFPGVEHRLEFIRSINNIPWYNDSIGTSPTRTIAGLLSFEQKIVLIAGGYDKHLKYEPIAKPILENCSKLILMGQTADKIEKAVTDEIHNEEEKGNTIELPIYRCKTLKETIDKALKVAIDGEIVLFSPASASFDLFKNFEERGNKFKKLVNDL